MSLQTLLSSVQEMYDSRDKFKESNEFILSYLLYSPVTDVKILSSLFTIFKNNDTYGVLFNAYANIATMSSIGILMNDIELNLYESILRKYVIDEYNLNYNNYLNSLLTISSTYIYDSISLPVFLKYSSIMFKQLANKNVTIARIIVGLVDKIAERKAFLLSQIDKILFETNRQFLLYRLNIIGKFDDWAYQDKFGYFLLTYKTHLYNIESAIKLKDQYAIRTAKMIFYGFITKYNNSYNSNQVTNMDLAEINTNYKTQFDTFDYLAQELNYEWSNIIYLVEAVKYFKNVEFETFVLDRITGRNKYQQALYSKHLATAHLVDYDTDMKQALALTSDNETVTLPSLYIAPVTYDLSATRTFNIKPVTINIHEKLRDFIRTYYETIKAVIIRGSIVGAVSVTGYKLHKLYKDTRPKDKSVAYINSLTE